MISRSKSTIQLARSREDTNNFIQHWTLNLTVLTSPSNMPADASWHDYLENNPLLSDWICDSIKWPQKEIYTWYNKADQKYKARRVICPKLTFWQNYWCSYTIGEHYSQVWAEKLTFVVVSSWDKDSYLAKC